MTGAIAVLFAASILNFVGRQILAILAGKVKAALLIPDAQLGFLNVVGRLSDLRGNLRLAFMAATSANRVALARFVMAARDHRP